MTPSRFGPGTLGRSEVAQGTDDASEMYGWFMAGGERDDSGCGRSELLPGRSVAGKGEQEVHCQKDKDDKSIIEEPDETGVGQEQGHQVRWAGRGVQRHAVGRIEEGFHSIVRICCRISVYGGRCRESQARECGKRVDCFNPS